MGLQEPYTSSIFQNTNPHHNTNNTKQQIIPPEGNTVNKLKEPYFKDKNVRKHCVIHQNYTNHCPYIHPCFQVTSLTIIYIHQKIGWYKRRKKIRFVVKLYGYCTQTPTPRTISLNKNPGPHRHHKILKIYQQVRIYYLDEYLNQLKTTKGN